MKTEDIAGLFRQRFKGNRNFMTPDILTYGKRGGLIYEISTGKGVDGATIYGVTVLELDGKDRHDLSKCLHSREDVDRYISRDFQP